MKIGIMLRHLGKQAGGIGTYTNNLLDQIVSIDTTNEYLFMYDNEEFLGSYAQTPSVEEIVVKSRSKLSWDQLAVPAIAKLHKLDLIFNPKMSVPLFTDVKSVFVFHGADWLIFPQNYPMYDRVYHKMFASLYCKKATAVISVSEDASQHIAESMKLGPNKLKTVYHAASERFRPIEEEEHMEGVRRKYKLPQHFILYLGQIYPMKNVGGIIEAYSKIRHKIPHKLVIVGKPTHKSQKDLGLIDKYGLQEDVILTGFVPDGDVPAFYNLADLFVFPSFYEGFGIPMLEAMACGCPVVTSNQGAQKEIAGGAAMLVDPYQTDDIAKGVIDVLSDDVMRQELIQKGFERAKSFTWRRTAERTLEVLEAASVQR